MANVVRYFSTAANGAGDGTTWADRAALIVSSAYNTIITGFTFSGSDSLECRIGPGSYSVPTMVAATFTTVPTAANPLWLMACNSDGTPWVPPEPAWCSAKPMWSTANMPVLTTSSAVTFVNLSHVHMYGLDVSSSVAGTPITLSGSIDWCRITNTASNSSCRVCDMTAANSVLRFTGTNYNTAGNTFVYANCRFEGNSSASAGSRRAINMTTANTGLYARCTFLNFVGGGGIYNNGTGRHFIQNCLFVNCTTAINFASATELGNVVSRSIITNSTTGITSLAGNTQASYNRLRNNTTNFSLGTHSKQFNNDESAGTDAAEFVNAAGGDYRIKNTSSLWGTNLGPGDEPASGSGGGIMLPFGYDDL